MAPCRRPASAQYTAPVAVNRTTTLKAIAVGGSYSASPVGTAAFNIVAVPATFSPPGGTYNNTPSVTLADTSTGVTIYYTTDGSTPTAASTPSGGPITVTRTTTIKAIAAGGNYSPSTVVTATY